jgi:hypothetical protein
MRTVSRVPVPSNALYVAALVAALLPAALSAQRVDLRAEEAAIRAAKAATPIPRVEDRVFWSGSLPVPTVGSRTIHGGEPRAFTDLRVEQRRDMRQQEETVRLEIAAAGDMAWEFGNGHFSYTMADTGQHVAFDQSFLRVWKKEAGEWKEAAIFIMPHNRAPPPLR